MQLDSDEIKKKKKKKKIEAIRINCFWLQRLKKKEKKKGSVAFWMKTLLDSILCNVVCDDKKCPAVVIGLDLMLRLSRVRLCSFKWSVNRLVFEAAVAGLN